MDHAVTAPAMSPQPAVFAPRRRRAALSRLALLALAFLMFVFCGYATYGLYRSEIRDMESGVQSEYKIDAYFYLYLGRQAINNAQRDVTTLYEAADAIRPNAASDGIVFLSALLQSVVPIELFVPGVLAVMLFIPIVLLVRGGHVSMTLAVLPFCGLLAYLQAPSKEAFFLMGLLACVWGLVGPRRLWAVPIGMALMYFGRREAFYLLIASVPLAWLLLEKWRGALTILALFMVYLGYREQAFDAARLAYVVFDQSDLAFCRVGPLPVCIEDMSGMEAIFVSRIVTLVGLPLKWIADALFSFEADHLTEILVRWCNVLQLVWFALVFRGRKPATGPAAAVRRVLLMFSLIYWLVYASVVYYQPTRQAILTLTYIGIAFLLRDARPARRFRQSSLDASGCGHTPLAATSPVP